MAVLDSEGFIIASNKQFENFLASVSASAVPQKPVNPDIQDEDMMPRSIRDILGSRQTSMFWASLMRLINRENKSTNFETELHPRHEEPGITHWYNFHTWLIDGDHGEASSIGLIIEDKTLIHQEVKDLLEDKKITEKAMEAKNQFLANMSHEIRTPIQTIIGMIELLQDTTLNPEQLEYSKQVKFSAEVLLTHINDILDFSKIEAGKMELEHIEFDLEENIEQAVEMISLEAHRKGLEIAVNILRECNIRLLGDPNKFRQIVINLVKNAVKFTQTGGITISAAFTSMEKKKALRIAVADTGIGISKEARSRLFTTFMQADVSNTRRFGGTGLGLAISRELVELMNGRIEMLPNKKRGSIFRFTIPLEIQDKELVPLPNIDKAKGYRIMVVDDREEPREIICSYLKDLGLLNADSAASGDIALKMMRDAASLGVPYTLCFLDMIMSGMDGWKLAAEIHNDQTISRADLILMYPQGQVNVEIPAASLKYFRARINKPIKRRNLAELINSLPGKIQELDISAETEHTVKREKLKETTKNAGEKLPCIMIVEDHPVNQKIFAMMVEKLGFHVVLADDGKEALEKTEAANPDIILMDIQMPRMNGYEAAEKLRKRKFGKPIIAISASISIEEKEKCFTSGYNDILFKPFKLVDLEKIIQKWLSIFKPVAGQTQVEAEPSAASGQKPLKRKTSAVRTSIKNSSIKSPSIESPLIDNSSTESSKNNEIFDIKDLRESCLNNDKVACSLLSRFIERTSAQIEAILSLQKVEDWETACREAHTIKGASLTLGGRELAKTAARLELAFKNIDHSEMEAGYNPLKEAFNRYKNSAEQFIQSIHSGEK